MELKKLKTEEIDSDGNINSTKSKDDRVSTVPCQEEFDVGLHYAMNPGVVATPNNDSDILDSNPVNQHNNQANDKDELEFNFYDESFAYGHIAFGCSTCMNIMISRMIVKQSTCTNMFDNKRVKIITPINSRFKMTDDDFNKQFDVYNYNVSTLSG